MAKLKQPIFYEMKGYRAFNADQIIRWGSSDANWHYWGYHRPKRDHIKTYKWDNFWAKIFGGTIKKPRRSRENRRFQQAYIF